MINDFAGGTSSCGMGRLVVHVSVMLCFEAAKAAFSQRATQRLLINGFA
jgi:hypothetical protein